MTFSPGPRMAEPRYKLSGGAAALPGTRVLVGAGGRSVELLDVPLGTTRPVAPLEGVASFATVTLLPDGRAVILGGYDDDIDLTRLALVVDTE